jgi:hypothetical protein
MNTEITTNIAEEPVTVKFAAVLADGLMFLGKRRMNILHTLYECGYSEAESDNFPHGFVDSKGNFLTPAEAATVALGNGQVTELKYNLMQPSELSSFDLFPPTC